MREARELFGRFLYSQINMAPRYSGKNFLGFLIAALAMLAGGCEEIPDDPRDTTLDIRQGLPLKAGAVHNPPWVSVRDGRVAGIEARLIEGFAASLGARVEWTPLDLDDGFERIEKGEIHVLIAGLLHTTPYIRPAALTRPYLVLPTSEKTLLGRQKMDRHVMAVYRGENRLLALLERHLKEEADRVMKEAEREARP